MGNEEPEQVWNNVWLAQKLDLITTEPVGDYYLFRSSENNKLFLVINSNTQMGNALVKIRKV